MQDLTVSIVQTPLYWQDASANRAMLEEKLWQLEQPTDLIVLPEMFNSGFTMDAKTVAEPMNFHTFKWMKQMAAQHKAVITGSMVVSEGGQFYNRLIWMTPDGHYETYDKRHLFRMANEHDHYSSGKQRLIAEVNGWKVCPLICYDLRFPVWSRQRPLGRFDLQLYVANWPAPRTSAWDALLKARAIENLSYCIGVNRVGEDGNGIAYSGHSAIYDMKGDTLYHAESSDVIKTCTLSYEKLTAFRDKFPAHLDADDFSLNL